MLFPKNRMRRMSAGLTSGPAVTGNMERRNLVQPYGTRVTGSAGFWLVTGRSGSRGAAGSGFQSVSTALARSVSGALSG
ncbi:MAG: hypothetical protein AUJ96_06280 [Armatimonadetes bacterium CG2_30_66_41]|nr:MAG: hypothetical protein AUJ96_06280 [Armatimonadetes bacterium CG2_30_66_41]PIU88506.1 MAG: hypothetical protein COS65_30475 [Armatimonadetes bacterium CG06_land_8_20_14_3_00_66_21]